MATSYSSLLSSLTCRPLTPSSQHLQYPRQQQLLSLSLGDLLYFYTPFFNMNTFLCQTTTVNCQNMGASLHNLLRFMLISSSGQLKQQYVSALHCIIHSPFLNTGRRIHLRSFLQIFKAFQCSLGQYPGVTVVGYDGSYLMVLLHMRLFYLLVNVSSHPGYFTRQAASIHSSSIICLGR